MTKRDQFGSFELMLILTLIHTGGNAYGVPICEELEKRTGRDVAVGSVYAALERLDDKGFVTSELGEPTPERGGRAKKYFHVSARGLKEVKDTLAHWLLKHFGSSTNNDAVIGDLNERYRNNHSSNWYWRQVMTTIGMSFFHKIRNHKLQAVRALLTGWLVKAVCLFAYSRLYAFPDRRMFFGGVENPLFVVLVAVAAMMFSGWLIACTNRPHSRAMVFLYFAVEWIALALTLGGVFIPYSSWALPLTRMIAAVFVHFQMVNAIVFSRWISLGITVASLWLGGTLCRNHEIGEHRATTPA